MLTLVFGGIRSGKSGFAEKLAGGLGDPVTYLATGIAVDEEMERRIQAHRESRPRHWQCVEEPYLIGGAVPGEAKTVLLESVDGWLANLMTNGTRSAELFDPDLVDRCAEEVAGLAGRVENLIAVSAEVGFSLVPLHPAGRAFADMLGLLNQRLASAAAKTYLVVAGMPVALGDGVATGGSP